MALGALFLLLAGCGAANVTPGDDINLNGSMETSEDENDDLITDPEDDGPLE